MQGVKLILNFDCHFYLVLTFNYSLAQSRTVLHTQINYYLCVISIWFYLLVISWLKISIVSLHTQINSNLFNPIHLQLREWKVEDNIICCPFTHQDCFYIQNQIYIHITYLHKYQEYFFQFEHICTFFKCKLYIVTLHCKGFEKATFST